MTDSGWDYERTRDEVWSILSDQEFKGSLARMRAFTILRDAGVRNVLQDWKPPYSLWPRMVKAMSGICYLMVTSEPEERETLRKSALSLADGFIAITAFAHDVDNDLSPHIYAATGYELSHSSYVAQKIIERAQAGRSVSGRNSAKDLYYLIIFHGLISGNARRVVEMLNALEAEVDEEDYDILERFEPICRALLGYLTRGQSEDLDALTSSIGSLGAHETHIAAASAYRRWIDCLVGLVMVPPPGSLYLDEKFGGPTEGHPDPRWN